MQDCSPWIEFAFIKWPNSSEISAIQQCLGLSTLSDQEETAAAEDDVCSEGLSVLEHDNHHLPFTFCVMARRLFSASSAVRSDAIAYLATRLQSFQYNFQKALDSADLAAISHSLERQV